MTDGRKMDKLSKSDPFIVVKWKTDSDETWREIGESAVLSFTLLFGCSVCCTYVSAGSRLSLSSKPISTVDLPPAGLDYPRPKLHYTLALLRQGRISFRKRKLLVFPRLNMREKRLAKRNRREGALIVHGDQTDCRCCICSSAGAWAATVDEPLGCV